MNLKALKISVITTLLYSVLSLVCSPFFVSWGAEKPLPIRMLIWMYKFPINWAYYIGNISLWFLVLHFIFWTIIIYFLIVIITKL